MGTARTASVRRLGQILAQSARPIFVLDADDRILYANSAWESLTGRTPEEMIGLECVPTGPIVENAADGDLRALGSSLAPPAEARRGQPASARSLILDRQGRESWRQIEFWPLGGPSETSRTLLGLVLEAESPRLAPESPSHQRRAELATLRAKARARSFRSSFLGDSPAHGRLLDQIEVASAVRTPAWIVAETGSGLRSVASQIHERGSHAASPFLLLDCVALAPDRLEVVLFGAREGSFDPSTATGATIVLKHADQLARDVQARLVGLLASRVSDPRPFRLLAASHDAPEAARALGKLRDDLYFHLTGLVLRIPPLRERLSDLPVLAQNFLELADLPAGRRPIGFSEAAIDALRSYDWPGNLSELARVIEAAGRAAPGELIERDDLPMTIRGEWAAAYPPPRPQGTTNTENLDAILELVERRLIEQALSLSRHNKSRAAERLGISRPRLYRRMKELNIEDLAEGPSSEMNQG